MQDFVVLLNSKLINNIKAKLTMSMGTEFPIAKLDKNLYNI